MTTPKTNPPEKSTSRGNGYGVARRSAGNGPDKGIGKARPYTKVSTASGVKVATYNPKTGKYVIVESSQGKFVSKSQDGYTVSSTPGSIVVKTQAGETSTNVRLASLLSHPGENIFPDEIMQNISDYRASLEANPSVE
jgi:hypothetical protein